MTRPLDEPLPPDRAKKLIVQIVKSGRVDLRQRHLDRRMGERAFTSVDVENVLRGGWVESSEEAGGTWRYRVRTNHMVVVVAFRSSERLVVVTAWRL